MSTQLGHAFAAENVPFLSIALAQIHRRAAVVTLASLTLNPEP
jgi:hypothetical protein